MITRIDIDDERVIELCDAMLKDGIDPQQAFVAGLLASDDAKKRFSKSQPGDEEKFLDGVGAR